MRKINFFEMMLLVICGLIVISGMYILRMIAAQGYPLLDFMTVTVLWLILIFCLVICAIAENGREELSIIISENSKEIKLLRSISKEQIEEIKLLRDTMDACVIHNAQSTRKKK